MAVDGTNRHKAGGVHHPLHHLPQPLANQASLEEVVASQAREVAVRLMMIITLTTDTGPGQVVTPLALVVANQASLVVAVAVDLLNRARVQVQIIALPQMML